MNINHKIQIGSYQGIRHAYCQPVHGQRNRTNGKTAKKLARQRAAQLGLNIVRAQAKSKHPQKRK
jgi:ribosomal protein S13